MRMTSTILNVMFKGLCVFLISSVAIAQTAYAQFQLPQIPGLGSLRGAIPSLPDVTNQAKQAASKYPPAKPGALRGEPLEAAGRGHWRGPDFGTT